MVTRILKQVARKLMRGKGRRRTPAGEKRAREAIQASHPVHPPLPAETKPHTRPRRRPPTHKKAWSPDQFDVPPQSGKARFHDLDLPVEILHAVADLDFRYCTPIQAESLPICLAGNDVAGRAQTGTGKTAAFLTCILAHMLRNPLEGKQRNATARALVIAPTRELVIQITKDAEALARYCGVRTLAVYGGMDYRKQEEQLRGKPLDLLIATPGRLLDFERRRCVSLRHVETLVIDEADRMLDMGFIPDVRRIIHAMPTRNRRQTLLFSATLTKDVMRLASQWMTEPVVVEIDPEKVAVDTVTQIVYIVTVRQKLALLCNLLKQKDVGRVLIFTNRRQRTWRVADELDRHGVECAALSGAVDQKKRLGILNAFQEGKVRVLVATDVAGRGLHVEGITHVINFDFPVQAVDYVHRIGRTGRVGATGTAISFACEEESFVIPDIEKLLGESLRCVRPEDELLVLPKALRPPARREPRTQDRAGGTRGRRSAGPADRRRAGSDRGRRQGRRSGDSGGRR